jgi:hypothetical protein
MDIYHVKTSSHSNLTTSNQRFSGTRVIALTGRKLVAAVSRAWVAWFERFDDARLRRVLGCQQEADE